MKFLIGIFKKIYDYINDFSDRGFILRDVKYEPIKIFKVSRMWVGKVGWSEGIKKNIIRCYIDGFSFWRGQSEDKKEWFCYYKDIISFHQPLGLKSASPILTIKTKNGSVDCMLGESTDFIKDYKENAN
tara:strand:- start:135 stop:521 length:387 start_codon:yes stop_codon:yes gene_type:complete